MDFETFMNEAIKEMRDRFPDFDISKQEVSKLQGESYTGMAVRPENSEIGATLNLQDFYKALGFGMFLEDVMDSIERSVVSAVRHMPHYDARVLEDYDRMKDALTVDLVPVAGNEEKLAQIPHKNVEDMALVYRFEEESSVYGSASILVTNEMLAVYDITADQLHEDAMKAAVQNRPAKLHNMNDVMRDMMGDMSGLFPMNEPSPLWVATVEGGQNGAGVIQYPGFLDQAAEALGGDFYVLPSSVHEVLLVADDGSMEIGHLEEMVRSVNETEVSPAERLSNNVYHYDSKAHIFENARTFEAREAAKEEILTDEPFDKVVEEALAKETIKVLLVEPEERPRVVEIGTGLEDLQHAVGGDIEVVYPFEDRVGLIVNEEGKLIGLPLNRALRDENNELYDIIAGPFLVAGLTEDNFGSLTEEQIGKFEGLFHQPETFVKMGRSIMAIPVPEEVLQMRDAIRAKEEMGEKPRHKMPERDSH
ncbi:DUF5688 family protein [uncultured Allofournierella sp.]|uniref:DUF5688 family protein n=1 Tax=uncultured Allofournierella sp. TaxID=1940258 RepID=UPI0025E22047|nr:DUF5688 family protein [uncultured Fournierella sp.]